VIFNKQNLLRIGGVHHTLSYYIDFSATASGSSVNETYMQK